ncbi:CYTH domain-containing protein [Myroides sp. LJL119]
MIEIERKFLVKDMSFTTQAYEKNHIVQGYLNSDPKRTVRIRIKNKQGFITVKGQSNSSGMSRYEWEKEIDFQHAQQLLLLCEEFVIEKTRYLIKLDHHVFEVDIFENHNQGLVLAEIELTSEQQGFSTPSWLGQEVTGDNRYYNSYLSKHPFSTWK